MNKGIIIAVIVIAIVVAVVIVLKKTGKCSCTGTSNSVSSEATALINEIMETGSSIPNFDASVSVLETKTIEELKSILTQVKEDAFNLANQ